VVLINLLKHALTLFKSYVVMNSSPAITVVIPAFNASTFLSETIQSVLSQTFDDWELLVIDDGSTDSTAEVVKSYLQQDDRVKLISQSNQGVSVARNIGIQHAKGQFIAFLDSDDRWLPNKLATHFKYFGEHSNVGVTFAKVEFISYEGDKTGVVASSKLSNLKPEDFLYKNPTITTSNIVVRREVFNTLVGFDANMSYSEDLEWLFRAALSGDWKVEGINHVLVQYRNTDQGLSSNLYRIEEGWRIFIEKARSVEPELVNQHYLLAQAVHLRYLARQSLRLNSPSTVGVDFMTRALQSNWRLIFKEPQRTILTVLAIYGKSVLSNLKLKFGY